ncbi:hypothetical protein IWQ57_002053 [Coemansia nantahalensis]|uniref:Uncharacterized protein n=1 Tax=Coemansia nantahalensis TaxID=2789366 RepID=A0ACC1K1Y9_9FUNG|nr:hypothetical protein IWQ57_002053 [Coemansia nantahalensis]
MDTADDNRSKKRLACLDTESSVRLSVDRSPNGDPMARASADKTSAANGASSLQNSQLFADDRRRESSGSHFVPRIHEVHGSSDSQLRISSLDLAGKLGGSIPPLDDSQSMSTNDASMATADMDLAEGSSPGVGGVSADMELQAAIDRMLQGQPLTMSPLHSAYLVGGHPQKAIQAADAPAAGPFALDTQSKRPALVQRIAQRGRGLGSRVVKRFSRRSDAVDDLSSDSLELMASDAPKKCTGRSAYTSYGGGGGGKPECVEYSGSPQDSTAQSRIAKLVAPVVRYMQRRPMAALGIVLGVLVALLAIIVVILVVGVFPYLMRATLQDVTIDVTSVRAAAPFQVARSLALNKASSGPLRLSDIKRFMRLAEEQDDYVPKDDPHSLALHKRDDHAAVHHPPPPPPVQRASGPNTHAVAQQHAQAAARSPQPAAHQAPRRDAAPTHALSGAEHHAPGGTPAAHSSSAGQHPPSSHEDNALPHTSPAAAASPPLAAAASAVHEEAEPAQKEKALDTAGHADSYTMQLGGTLNSGGPIGIDIEFTEPLRMYWHDMEIGSISRPEKIHVPGHDSVEWRWAPFTVTMPGAPDALLPGALGRVDKKLVVARGMLHDERGAAAHQHSDDARAADAGSRQGALADWFATIQAHRSFTMEWRSRVRVSAMGMHTSNVRFEKTVHVSCASASECVVNP